MTAKSFNLIFTGQIAPEHKPEDVQRTLEGLFELGEAGRAGLFSGQSLVLGENLNAATASAFQNALACEGAITQLEEIRAISGVDSSQNKRSAERRIYVKRRAQVRDTAIQPDRRQDSERREK